MSSTVQVHSMPGSPNDACQQCHGWGYKPPLSATPHLHYAYSKVCLSTSLWYAVDMHLGTPFGWDTCAGGGEFLDNWDKAPVARGTSDDMVSWLRLQPPPPTASYIPHSYYMYMVQIVWTPWYAVDGRHMGAPLPVILRSRWESNLRK